MNSEGGTAGQVPGIAHCKYPRIASIAESVIIIIHRAYSIISYDYFVPMDIQGIWATPYYIRP